MKSPFKFLDAYTKQDQHLFFGRDDEIEELYQRVFKSNLLLVYGASGTGKTSLIQCGLSAKFSDENWFSVSVRRQGDINKSLFAAVEKNSVTKVSREDLDPEESEIVQRVEGLYLDHFKPIYLIFDQLEELFILGNEDEQNEFYRSIHDLVNSNIQCKVILVIREEYIAELSKMEEVIPNLFDNRVRIEKMRKRVVKNVIAKSCTAIPGITIQDKEPFLNKVVENLSEDELTVELTYLQVYLDKLYRNAEVKEGVHLFNMDLLEGTGKVHDVLTQFLEEQVQNLPDADLGWKILKVFITKDGTKRSASLVDVKSALERKNDVLPLNEIRDIIYKFVDAKILTALEGSLDLFEFTHDSLAIKTFEKLDAKERNLFEIQSLITQQYKGYENRGILLSRENLLYVTPYLKELNLNKEYKNFIKKSRREINRIRTRKIAAIISVMAALSILSLFLIFKIRDAEFARDDAERQTALAKERTAEAEKARQIADSAKKDAENSETKVREAQEKLEENLKYADLKTKEAEAQKKIAEEARKSLEVEKNKSEKNLQLKLNNEKSTNLANRSREYLIANPNAALGYAAEAYELHTSKTSIGALMNAFHQPLKIDQAEFSASVKCVAYHQENNKYFVGLENGNILICDDKMKNCKTILGHKGSIETIAISLSGDRVYTSASDWTLKIWDGNGAFVKSKEGVSSVAVKIKATKENEVIVAYESGRIISYDSNLNNENFVIKEAGILGVRNVLLTKNSDFLVLDQSGRIWLFNQKGELLNTIFETKVESIAIWGQELYYLKKTGVVEQLNVSKLFNNSLKSLKGTQIQNIRIKGKHLELIDKNLLLIKHERGYNTILNLKENLLYGLYVPEPSMVPGYSLLENNLKENFFMTCTSDGYINAYDLSHLNLPEFKSNSFSIKNGDKLISGHYSLEVYDSIFILKDQLNKDYTITFKNIEKMEPIKSSNDLEDLYRNNFGDLILEAAIFRNPNSSYSIRKQIDIDTEGVDLRIRDKSNNIIYNFEKLRGVKSVVNVLISENQKFALLITINKNEVQQAKLYPLPEYIYEFAKMIDEK